MAFFSSARRYLKRFKRDERGVTAVEFALILPPFLLLTCGTLEIALLQLTKASLSNAVTDVTRPIYTGTAGCTQDPAVYKTQICSKMPLGNQATCEANTRVILRQLDGGFAAPNVLQDWDSIAEEANEGQSEEVMMMLVYSRRKMLLPMIDGPLGGSSGYVTLAHSTAFRNEPFGAAGGC